MVRGGRYMEAEKRISEIDWSWAVSTINRVVNDQLKAIEQKAKNLTFEGMISSQGNP